MAGQACWHHRPVLPAAPDAARATACLQQGGLEDLGDRLPSELSGGQQQRVAIARALANNPPALVADEPTGNLDSKRASQVFDVLEELVRRGKTVIYLTHDRDLAARASDFIRLLDGRVVSRSESLGLAAETVRAEATP
jgi:ABC-type lipoprotein export system ATPase subunit